MLKQFKRIRDVIEISYNDTFKILAGIAQLVERLLAKQKVAGSNPVSRSIFNNTSWCEIEDAINQFIQKIL